MTTTVRIRPEDKALLDQLQARYLLAAGRRIPLDAVLHKVIGVAARHADEVVGAAVAPLTREEMERVLALPYDFGRDTSPGTIDEEIYGA